MTRKPPPDPAWLKEVEDVRPLGAKAPPQPPTPKMPPPTNPDIWTPPVKRHVVGWNDSPAFPVATNTAELIAGHNPTMDMQVWKRLTKGDIRPTALLDLHGLGEGDAWLELVDFLHAAVVQDHRCAIVIHGKGTGFGPQRNMGVIKFQVGTWLASHPKVLAFHTAIQADGGTGAIYVYLKRHGH